MRQNPPGLRFTIIWKQLPWDRGRGSRQGTSSRTVSILFAVSADDCSCQCTAGVFPTQGAWYGFITRTPPMTMHCRLPRRVGPATFSGHQDHLCLLHANHPDLGSRLMQNAFACHYSAYASCNLRQGLRLGPGLILRVHHGLVGTCLTETAASRMYVPECAWGTSCT